MQRVLIFVYEVLVDSSITYEPQHHESSKDLRKETPDSAIIRLLKNFVRLCRLVFGYEKKTGIPPLTIESNLLLDFKDRRTSSFLWVGSAANLHGSASHAPGEHQRDQIYDRSFGDHSGSV
jgi:hypothetical protein